LVGAGPGNLGLVTLRAKECVEQADVIVYDYLSNPQILRWARPDAEVIYAGKKAGNHALKQDEINELLVRHALAGKKVLRLKGGDPMIFGRGGEEAEELRDAGVDFEIVPGISSTIGGPAFAGIPVTHREHNSELLIFTGHEDPEKGETSLDYAKIAANPGTKVFLMGVGRMRQIMSALIDAGADPKTPIALVRWATTPKQETLVGTLGDIADKVEKTGFASPAVAVIGNVVKLRDRISWFENRPLFGKRIVVTRTRQQAGELSRELDVLGADVFELPTIRKAPPTDLEAFGRLVLEAHKYSWIVFTSPIGVDAFFDLYYKIYDDARSIGGARIAAVGPGTARRIKDFHLKVDLMPELHVAEGLVKAFKKDPKVGSLENETVLWVRPEEARDVITKGLTEAGAIVDEALAYKTVAETEDISGGQERLREEGADVITFTSSSTVEHFFELGIPLPEGCKIASIGPVTSATIMAFGHKVDIEARSHDIPGLVKAIEKYFG